MKLSVNQIKYLKSLQIRKFRQSYRQFTVEGAKMATEVLTDGRQQVEAIFALPEWLDAQAHSLKRFAGKVTAISQADLEKISSLNTPNQALLVLRQPEYDLADAKVGNDLSLYLENVQDPGNLGTMLRIADWFGIGWVFLSENCVEAFNPKVVQAGMGAFLRVKTLEISLLELKTKFPALPVVGAVLDGENIFQATLPPAALLVIGNESKGISPETERELTHRICIPRHENGGAESLNAAVAAGILCALFRSMK